MAEITIHHDKGTNTLTNFFGDPNREVNCDHTESDVIVMLDEDGLPLGIEVLEYHPGDGPLRVTFDEVDTSAPRIRAAA